MAIVKIHWRHLVFKNHKANFKQMNLSFGAKNLCFIYEESWSSQTGNHLRKYNLFRRLISEHLLEYPWVGLAEKKMDYGISLLKVCHSSSFQTISVRSVYIKIINHTGSIHVFANLSKTMQTKQHAMKKNRTRFHIETRFTRDYILWCKDLKQKMFKMFSKLELYYIYLYFYMRCFS